MLTGGQRCGSRRAGTRCAIAGALLLAAASSVLAERPSKLEPPDAELYRRWGPLRARPGFEISNFGYDTNILVSPEGSEVPDYTITLTPRLEGLVLLGGSAFLTFRERFSYVGFLENTDQSYPENRFEGRLTLPARRAGVFAEVELNNLQLRPTELEDIRTRATDRRLQAGIILEPGGRTEVQISAVTRGLSYDDPDNLYSGNRTVGDVLDRTESGLDLEASWLAKGRTELTLEARLEEIDFRVDGLIGGNLIDRDGAAWRVLPGLRFGEDGRLVGEVKAGWARYTSVTPQYPEFSDWVGELSLAYRLGWRTRLILDGERLPGFSLIQGSPYYLNTETGLRVIHYLNRLIGVEAGAKRGRLTFPGTVFADPREDRLFYRDLGVRLRAARGAAGERLEYSLRVVRYTRESNVESAGRTRTTVSLGAVVGF